MHVTKRTYHDFCGRISVLTRFIDPMGLTGVFGLVAGRANAPFGNSRAQPRLVQFACGQRVICHSRFRYSMYP